MAQEHLENIIPMNKPAMPVLNPQLGRDLAALLEAEMQLRIDREMIKKLAAMLATMKNPMYGVQEIMGAIMNMQGDQISGLAAVDNIDSDLRSEVGSGQSSFNGIGNNTKASVNEAKAMIAALDQIKAFLDYEKSLGKKAVIDSADIKNLEDAIKSIKGAFGKDWGNARKMAGDIQDWVHLSKEGKYAPQLKTILNGFQTLNQSVSALSTTTNTKLQFETEQYKQFLGIDETANQAYLKLITTSVNNERSN